MFRGSDASVVVKVLVSRLVAGRVEAGSEGVEPSAIGFGSRGTTVAQAQSGKRAHDVVRVVCGSADEFRRERLRRLPAHDGPAGIGRIPSSRLQLAMES